MLTATALALLSLLAPANLATNAGFEPDAKGWNLPPSFALDPTTGHTGQACLRVVNTDPKLYRLATLSVPCQPGHTYRFSAWIRTQGVAGPDSGATVCLEWSGAKGWLGGNYPSGHKGDTDWTQVVGDGQIPDDATTVQLTLYLRKGCTGTAWFDDVEVTEVFPDPLRMQLFWPNYRGRVRAHEPDARAMARLRISSHLAGDLTPRDTKLTLALLRDGQAVRTVDASPTGPQMMLGMDLTGLDAANYVLKATLAPRAGGAVLGEATDTLELYTAADPPLTVDFDPDGVVKVEGKRFFPLGLYLSGLKPADLATIAAGGFNTVMPYGVNSGSTAKVRADLDAVKAAGLKILYSIKDLYHGTQWSPKELTSPEHADETAVKIVQSMKDHPAVLGWYLNDELPTTMLPILERRYQLVRAADRQHPCWSVLYQYGQMEDYQRTADVLGTDPYPIPAHPPAMALEWTAATQAAAGPFRAVWQVPQLHDWGVYHEDAAEKAKDRAPNLGELRCMTWLCLAAGAKGLIYYSWFDLQRDKLGFAARWKDATTLAAEVRQLEPWLLSQTPAPDLQLTPSDAKTLAAHAWRDGKQTLVLAANGGTAPGEIAWQAPRGKLTTLLGHAKAVGPKAITLAPGEAVALVMP